MVYKRYILNLLAALTKGGFSPLKKAMILILVLSLLSTFIPHSTKTQSENTSVVIQVDSLNVRSGPGLSYPVVYGVKKDQTYEVLAKDGEWIKIQISQNSSGWVSGWLVSEQSKNNDSKPAVQKDEKMESTADGLRIRKGPGTSFQVIGSVNKGDVLQYKEKSESWVRISFKQVEGWVHSDYLKGIPAEDSGTSTVQKKGTVTASSLNVRGTPSLSSSVIGNVAKGEVVTISGENSDWYEIQLKNNKGWVHKDYIKINTDSPENSNKPETTKTATVTATILNVRDGYSLSGAVIDRVKNGEKLTVLSEQNNWANVRLSNGKVGWVAGWYLEMTTGITTPDSNNSSSSSVTILYDTTNIRNGPSTSHNVIERANQGDSFTIIEKVSDWYKISLTNGQVGYVAGWIVATTGSVEKVERPGMTQYLSGKTIVLDPGHGGRDSGAKGVRGIFEKELTLRTAKLLDEKLRAAGAKSVLTRSQDVYVSLNNRVSFSHYYQADAFLSLHYDSTIYPSAKGITSYYYNKSKDQSLAQSLQAELIRQTSLSDRGVKYGNLHVLRENKRPSVLLELGFLSNISEEAQVSTSQYQEQVTTAIFNGLAQQFK
jgi:N-acetylmuramoyl-L-alanine amidase